MKEVKVWGKVFRDDSGKPMRAECIFMDISDEEVHNELLTYFARRIAEDELKKKEAEEPFYIQ